MTGIKDTIIKDAKEVAHQAIAMGCGAAGMFFTANAVEVADDVVTGNVDGLEHLGVGFCVAVGLAAWGAAKMVLAAIFGGTN